MSLKWLYLDLNSYFASVEQQLQPLLRHRPVAIVPSLTDITSAIAASYEAKAYGIKTGMKIYEAKLKCPDLICVVGKHENYVNYHHLILNEINKYIPIEKSYSIDEVVCKLLGSQTNETNALNLAKAIKLGLSKNIGKYLRCSIGLAENVFLAKTASNLEKPDGLQVIYAKDMPERIAHFKLSDLTGIGKAMEHRLNKAGIFTVKQLFRLEPKHMRKIWGSVLGERFWYLLRGYNLPDVQTSCSSLGHSHVLEPSWRPVVKARHVMSKLLLKAATRLRSKKYYTKHMILGVRIENGQKLTLETSFYRSCDNVTLSREASKLWSALVQIHKPRAIKKISVTFDHLVAEDKIENNFFELSGDSPFKKQKTFEKLSLVMDGINHKFGKDSIIMGGLPKQAESFSGTKIAFTRIPDLQELKN